MAISQKNIWLGIVVCVLVVAIGIALVQLSSQETASPTEGNIRVSSPRPGETVGLFFTVRGEARVFENAFQYRLRDAAGTVLVEGFGTAQAPDIGQFGPFEITIALPPPHTEQGTLEVFSGSPKDGTEINMVSVPLRLTGTSGDTTTISVFFPNQQRDPESKSCERTYAAQRVIPKTSAPARAALEQLLLGPTTNERNEGFFTAINPRVAIRQLTIEDGVAYANFSRELSAGVAGSCRVAALWSQITETLKQFPTVQSVIIAVEGRREGILQP